MMRGWPLFVSGIFGDDDVGTNFPGQFKCADGHCVFTQCGETDLRPRRERCHGEYAQCAFDRIAQRLPANESPPPRMMTSG